MVEAALKYLLIGFFIGGAIVVIGMAICKAGSDDDY